MRTLIKARYVIGYQEGRHALLENGHVLIERDRVVAVGRSSPGGADRTIDASDKLLIPGFVTVHSHVTNSPLTKSFLEDQGNPFHYMSGLYEFLAVTDTTPADALLSARASFVEMLRSGITTVVELGGESAEDIVELAANLGIRAYVAPMYRSGRWSHARAGHRSTAPPPRADSTW